MGDSGDSGLVVRPRTHDRGVPAEQSDFFLSKKIVPRCSSSHRCINGYPDRAVFVQV